MYGGPSVDIEIAFNDALIGVVYDKFGENTKMTRSGSSECTVKVKVQISPTFWGWLFQFAGQMRILSPDSVVRQYNEQLNKAYQEV